VNTGAIYKFNGTTYSDEYVNNKIRLKIKDLTRRTIDLDDRYGLTIRGLDSTFTPRFYYAAIETSTIVGCGEFKTVPIRSFLVHNIKNNETTYMPFIEVFFTGPENYNFLGFIGYIHNWMYDFQTDNFIAIGCTQPETHREIVSSHTPSDDIGTMQHFFLKHLEGHIYHEPDVAYRTGFNVSATAQNDIGQTVTTAPSVQSVDDINYQGDIVGHRIRHKLDFTTAGWIMTGIVNYYRSQDKKTYANASDSENTGEMAIQTGLVFGLGRYQQLIDSCSGNSLSSCDDFGAATVADYSRVQGPDGLNSSAYQFNNSSIYVGKLAVFSSDITAEYQYQITFWLKNTAASNREYDIIGNYNVDRSQVRLQMFNTSGVTTLRLVRIYQGTQTSSDLVTVNDLNWHFYRVYYSGSGHTLHVSVDMDTENVFSNQQNYATGLLRDPIIVGFQGYNLFDLRVFTLPIPQTALLYYYNDVLAGGAKTLPII
jgi:hypothetical protein